MCKQAFRCLYHTLFSWTANTKKVPKKPFWSMEVDAMKIQKIYFLKSSVIVIASTYMPQKGFSTGLFWISCPTEQVVL